MEERSRRNKGERKRWRKEAEEIKEEEEVEERSRRNKGGERGGGKKQKK